MTWKRISHTEWLMPFPKIEYRHNKTEHKPYQKVKSSWTLTSMQSCLAELNHTSRCLSGTADTRVGRNYYLVTEFWGSLWNSKSSLIHYVTVPFCEVVGGRKLEGERWQAT